MGRWHLIAYAAPAMPLALLGLPLYAYVPKIYADLPEIGLGLAGLLLFISRLFDLVTDPLMGSLADRLRSRVHPLVWIVSGVPVVLFGVWYLFNPGPGTSALDLLLSAGITYLGWTLMIVPYHAWGAELQDQDQGRRRLSVWREGAVLCGALLALLAAAWPGEEGPLIRMAWLITLLLPLAVALTWKLPRNRRPLATARPLRRTPLWRRLHASAWRLVGLHFANALAAGIPATLFLMFAEQRLGLDMAHSGWLLLVYFGAGIMALPLWLRLARRFGDTRTWGMAVFLAAIAFVPAAWLGVGDLGLFAAICVLTGATLGADIALPAAILARLANRESQRQGRPSEGSAFGIFGMAGKLALAFAVGISLPLLQLFGDDTGLNPLLPWFYALVPAVIKFLVGAMLFLWASHWDESTSEKDAEEVCNETNELVTDSGVRLDPGRV